MSNGYRLRITVKRALVIVLLLIQIFLFTLAFTRYLQVLQWLTIVLQFISFFVALAIINRTTKSGFKLSWVFLILAFPLVGGILYLLFSFQGSAKKMDRCLRTIESQTKGVMFFDKTFTETLDSPDINQMRYLMNHLHYPACTNTETKFLCPGEAFLPVLLEELMKAEKYIFMEYFIFQPGAMLDSILDILEAKAREGVEVRIIFDDFGCFVTVPSDFQRQLERRGIKAIKFNPFRPILTAVQNNRDHRKIASIDGKVAFTGGINLSDEYINAVDVHGRWEDSAIMVSGDAAWCLTVIFLQMWNLNTVIARNKGRILVKESQVTSSLEDFSAYKPVLEALPEAQGIVIPYADSPMDDENIGEHIYMQIISNARKYLYITSPYLIIDDSMVSALKLAAKGGVDVRIITPHNGDKKFVHDTTRTYYKELILSGVKIYEFNGFIHSKTFVCDDMTATVGTINLDFRSMYLHYECGVWLHEAQAVMEVKQRFLQEIESSFIITEQTCKDRHFNSLGRNILRLVAPLM